MGTRMFAIVKDMLKSVYNLNELSFSDMLEAAFEMYPVRVVCADIIAPMMCEIGSMWERGEIMVVMEHFASNVVIAKLKAMLHKQNTTINSKGPVVIVGCAPDEFHEIGALIVSFFMSLNGWKVIYLGQNVPPSDIMNIVDTMEVHTVAMSASSERSLASLRVIGQHIASRAKRKKVEFLVGGRLLNSVANILETIPAATTRSADDLYGYCPPTHPAHQDTMVRGALDGSYSLIRESYRKMRLASERRKRTDYLLDQITDDGTEGDKTADFDVDDAELSETMEKMLVACDTASAGSAGSGRSSASGVTIKELPDEDDEGEEGATEPKTKTKEGKPTATTPKEEQPKEERPNGRCSATSSPVTTDPASSVTSPGTAARMENEKLDLKERMEKQKQQTLAMKEMLQKYKDGKKAAEQTIARSRAFLNENRLVSAKKKPAPPVDSPPKDPPTHPPATPYVPPAGGNRLVQSARKNPTGAGAGAGTTTKFIHMHDPAAAAHQFGFEKDDPYYPQYTNMPRMDSRDSCSSSSNSLSDDDTLEEGIV